jgi:predicted anti-sigma-YlaC factor YlaD
MRPAHARWLKQYRSLTEDGNWAYLEIADSDLLAAPLPSGCVASAFANRDLYLVLANYGQSQQQIETSDAYVPADDAKAAPVKRWRLPRRSLRIVRYCG